METPTGKKRLTTLLLGSLLVLLLMACRSGNQVTGSSAFVDDPDELPLGKMNVSSIPPTAAAPEKQPNWITGVVE